MLEYKMKIDCARAYELAFITGRECLLIALPLTQTQHRCRRPVVPAIGAFERSHHHWRRAVSDGVTTASSASTIGVAFSTYAHNRCTSGAAPPSSVRPMRSAAARRRRRRPSRQPPTLSGVIFLSRQRVTIWEKSSRIPLEIGVGKNVGAKINEKES